MTLNRVKTNHLGRKLQQNEKSTRHEHEMGICDSVGWVEDQRSEGLGFDSRPGSWRGVMGKLLESHTLPLCAIVTIDCLRVYIQIQI